MSAHGVALQEKNRVVCMCGAVCDARIGKSPDRILGSNSDYFVAVSASTIFAHHLRAMAAADGESA